MNPELPAPQITPEAPRPQNETERLSSVPERSGEQSHEREQNMQRVDKQSAPPLPPPIAPLPLPAVPVPVPTAPVTDDSVGPTIASDDDLIEKEWVDKAKQIIAATKDDPYKREQEVNKLQADYLRKRYGKELGASD